MPDQDQRQQHPPAWATLFDRADPPMFPPQEPAQEPAKTSSAAKHARGVRAKEQAAARRGAVLAEEFRRRQEAAENDPLRGVPTADIHATQYALRHRKPDDQDAAEAERSRLLRTKDL